ncbi:sulfotransferase [Ornithinimicrobium faecis]|uniref:Sulfotransferase n=1 Tax=Ornithinimicrobium faecis TaxID=2934158 RepID=A0ABY4YT89_9MICO|nr:sulfotransferase [Ornithinimicrobium sp. HY1793]USQ79802.1 sulfotransferase [Ornithinimicrobium sp. HY1793]
MTTTEASGERLFLDYCRSPEKFWPERAQRQARKINQRLRKLSVETGRGRDEVLTSLWSAAQQRSRTRRRTVHLANIGSSGSHWLEHMLVDGAGMLGAGEVYLPRVLHDDIRGLEGVDGATFTDALHLLHAGGTSDDATATVVHSMHSANPDVFLKADPGTLRVLLLRNPVDVCLSRVFRKGEYRQDVAPDADDMAYLQQNIVTIKQFLTAAKEQVFDLVVRYENLLTDPLPVLGAVCALTGTPLDADRLERTIQAQSAERLAGSSGARSTNLFVGAAPTVPAQARRHAQEQLAALGGYFGYPVTDA